MAIRDILIIPDKRLRLSFRAGESRRCGTARFGRRHVRHHVRGARHRPCRHPDRRGARWSRWISPRRTDAAGASGVPQSGNPARPPTKPSIHEEGCSSIPEYYEEVERPARVKVKYLDMDFKPQKSTPRACSPPACSTRSTYINGVLFIDHILKPARHGDEARRKKARRNPARTARSPTTKSRRTISVESLSPP